MALSMRPVVSKAVKTVVGRNPLLMPNLVFKAIRSPTAKPNEIVFRVAPNMNKFEIKSYVQKIYDTKVLGIKTFNYMGKTKRSRQNQEKRVLVKDPKYKRVVITLDHLFEYPSAQGKKKQAEVHDGQSKVAEHVPTPPKPWDKDVAARKKALSKEKAKKRYARKVKVAQLKLEQAQGAKASSQKIKPKPASAKPKPAPVKTPAAVAESSQPAESSKPKAKKAKAVSGDNKK